MNPDFVLWSLILALVLFGIDAISGFSHTRRMLRWLIRRLAATELTNAANQHAAALAEISRLKTKFSGIADVEKALQRRKEELTLLEEEYRKLEMDQKTRKEQFEEQYKAALGRYTALTQEVSLYENKLEDISAGVYDPHFTFHDSAEYKTALENIRNQCRALVQANQATKAPVQWYIGSNKREGDRMTKLITKVLLRSFNGECEAIIADVSWNNIARMEDRARKSYAQVNALGDALKISITPEYLELKLNEIRLTHEFEQKKYQEKEEQRAQREQLREDAKAQDEIEAAQEEAEQQEHLYQELLGKARKEAAEATGTQLQELTGKVASFEAKLDEARKKKEKAIARAQLTKSGFVYIISNIGAFGEGVFKIGMTRRMEPMERIIELSGAAVPFPFDLHAMLYSDNAPEIESALHQFFEARKLNLVNPRKEFYHGIALSEIETFVRERGLSAQFIGIPEARQYRETLAIREGSKKAPATASSPKPETKFAEAFA